MDTKDVLLELRTRKGLSQDELAEKIHVTRQAVSRWENGETTPNTETLKLLSSFFDVSINTLLGSPRQLICQCCGMPLDDTTISKEPNGDFNEEEEELIKKISEFLKRRNFDEMLLFYSLEEFDIDEIIRISKGLISHQGANCFLDLLSKT